MVGRTVKQEFITSDAGR